MIFSTSDVTKVQLKFPSKLLERDYWFWCFAYSYVQASNHRQESPRAGGLPVNKLSTYKRSLSFGPDAEAMKTYDSETALCSATASCSDVRFFHAICLHCFPPQKKSISPLFCILYPWCLLPDLTSLWCDIFHFCALTVGWATGMASGLQKAGIGLCRWWWFDWNLARVIAPVVSSTSITLSSNKIQNGDILLPAYRIVRENGC